MDDPVSEMEADEVEYLEPTKSGDINEELVELVSCSRYDFCR
jgi:hypothetical protein